MGQPKSQSLCQTSTFFPPRVLLPERYLPISSRVAFVAFLPQRATTLGSGDAIYGGWGGWRGEILSTTPDTPSPGSHVEDVDALVPPLTAHGGGDGGGAPLQEEFSLTLCR